MSQFVSATEASIKKQIHAKEIEIRKKNKEILKTIQTIFGDYKGFHQNKQAKLYAEIGNLQNTAARKDRVINTLKGNWRKNTTALEELKAKHAKLIKEKDAEISKAIKNGSNTTKAEAVENNQTAEMEEIIAENDALKAEKIRLKDKLKQKNIRIRQLKIALRDYVEEDFVDDDNVGADIDAVVGEDPVFVEVDSDRDVAMHDKASNNNIDLADEEDEEGKDEEGAAKRKPSGTAVVDKNDLLDQSDSDPSEESFEIDEELLKAELKEQEKDKKHIAKTHTKKKSNKKNKKNKKKEQNKKRKAAAKDLEINENEL